MPHPSTQTGWGISGNWFSWTPLLAMTRLATAASFADVSKLTEFDSKAQRKIELGDDIYVALENESSTDGAQLLFMARILIKTH